ncbi:hypothetical protein ZWY2020_057051 [Hordeum vulgare]|nr:hypothetical protein ZWY2020_057051 [Hordeum vulgare]
MSGPSRPASTPPPPFLLATILPRGACQRLKQRRLARATYRRRLTVAETKIAVRVVGATVGKAVAAVANLRRRTPNPQTTDVKGGTPEAPWRPVDRKGRRCFWTGKNVYDVVGAFRRIARGVPAGNIPWEAGPSRRRAAAPAAAVPPASPKVPLPSEQTALRQDGDPTDTPGLLAAPAQSAEEAARAAVEEALDEAHAMAAVQQVMALEAAAEEDGSL